MTERTPQTKEEILKRIADMEAKDAERDRQIANMEAKKSGQPMPAKSSPVAEPTPGGNRGPNKIVDPTTQKDIKGNKKIETKKQNPAEEILHFITEYDLESSLSPEFKNLDEAQKLLVIHGLKQRIVDMVKADAQTQYSEDLKSKKGLKFIFSSFRAGINKNRNIKILEAKAFKEINGTDAGKQLIAENLAQLTQMAKGREVEIGEDGKPNLIYINKNDIKNASLEEKASVIEFNIAANAFRALPYEWGQEKSGKHKKAYEEAKAAYEKARNEILNIQISKETEKTKREEIVTSLLQLDNILQLDQLLNTHPEFEKLLNDLPQNSTFKEQLKDVLHTVTGGNILAFGGGIGARMLAGGAALATGISALTIVAAPVIGAAVGGYRGKMRAEGTLEEKKITARHGQKDESKERVHTTDVTLLNQRLERTIKDLEFFNIGDTAKDKRMTERKLSLLILTIDHVRGKIERGQVNFGDPKLALTNQFALTRNLNYALTLKESLLPANKDAVEKNIDSLLATYVNPLSQTLETKTSEAQKTFVKEQMKKGAKWGAGFALAGYTVRSLGEHIGWWGGNGAEQAGGTNFTEEQKDVIHAKFLHTQAMAKAESLKMAHESTTNQPDPTHVARGDSSIVSKSTTPETSAGSQRTAGTLAETKPAAVAAGGAVAQEGQKATEATIKAAAITTPEKGVASIFTKGTGENHLLTGPTEIQIGTNPANLDHALEKLFLGKTLPTGNLSEGNKIIINKIFAARTLNEIANLKVLLCGGNVAGIKASELIGVISVHDGVIEVKDVSKLYEIIEDLHEHSGSQKLLDIFEKDNTSAVGYTGNVDWVEKVHAANMPGIGHPEFTNAQVDDLSQYKNVPTDTGSFACHHIGPIHNNDSETIAAIKKDLGIPEETADLNHKDYHKDPNPVAIKGTNPADRIITHTESSTPEPTPAPRETPSGRNYHYDTDKSLGINQGTGVKGENFSSDYAGQNYQGNSRYGGYGGRGSYSGYNNYGDPRGYGGMPMQEIQEMFENNPYNLSMEMLQKVEGVQHSQMEHLFGDKAPDVWNEVKEIRADKLLEKVTSPENAGTKESIFAGLLKKASAMAFLEPKSGGWFSSSEKAGDFYMRCLQKIAAMSQLGKLK